VAEVSFADEKKTTSAEVSFTDENNKAVTEVSFGWNLIFPRKRKKKDDKL
jgi:hypothetical protein